ncbi:MAG: hypothetical protein QW165_01025 [Candidatus Woesearchaeota archaeon]
MNIEKGVILAAVILVGILAIITIRQMTGAQIINGCPEGFVYKQGYCIDPACTTGQVRCILENNVLKPQDCVCVTVMGKFLCGIKGDEETAVKTPLCTRRGQLDKVCGVFNPETDMCVPDE